MCGIRLRIQHCHGSSSGCCCGTGSIPGPGNFCMPQAWPKKTRKPKKKKKKKKNQTHSQLTCHLLQEAFLSTSSSLCNWAPLLWVHQAGREHTPDDLFPLQGLWAALEYVTITPDSVSSFLFPVSGMISRGLPFFFFLIIEV